MSLYSIVGTVEDKSLNSFVLCCSRLLISYGSSNLELNRVMSWTVHYRFIVWRPIAKLLMTDYVQAVGSIPVTYMFVYSLSNTHSPCFVPRFNYYYCKSYWNCRDKQTYKCFANVQLSSDKHSKVLKQIPLQ